MRTYQVLVERERSRTGSATTNTPATATLLVTPEGPYAARGPGAPPPPYLGTPPAFPTMPPPPPLAPGDITLEKYVTGDGRTSALPNEARPQGPRRPVLDPV